MSANAPPKTARQTWLDWLDPNEPEPTELYTREQIAEMASGIDPVTGEDLRYWEYQGILPRSIRRRHEGATRAVYPAWYANLAMQVRRLQRQSLSLEDIRSQIRRPITLEGSWSSAGTSSMTTTHAITPPDELVAALNAFARDYAEASGSSVTHIELSIELENGIGSIFRIPIEPESICK